MFCPNCGKEVLKDRIRCSNCRETNWLTWLGDGVPYFVFGSILLFGAYITYVFIEFRVDNYFHMRQLMTWTLPLFIYGTIFLTLFTAIRIAQVRLQKKTSFCHNCGKKFTANIIGCPNCKNIDRLTYWGTKLCLAFGIFMLFGAFLSHIYSTRITWGFDRITIYPFRKCILLLLIPGIAFLITYATLCTVLRKINQKES